MPGNSATSSSNNNQSNNIRVHTLPFTQQDFYTIVGNPKHGQDDPNPRVRFVGIVAQVIGTLVLPCWKQLETSVRFGFVGLICYGVLHLGATTVSGAGATT